MADETPRLRVLEFPKGAKDNGPEAVITGLQRIVTLAAKGEVQAFGIVMTDGEGHLTTYQVIPHAAPVLELLGGLKILELLLLRIAMANTSDVSELLPKPSGDHDDDDVTAPLPQPSEDDEGEDEEDY